MDRSRLPRATAEEIIAMNPCWLEYGHGTEDEAVAKIRRMVPPGGVDAIQVLECDSLRESDAIWLACHLLPHDFVMVVAEGCNGSIWSEGSTRAYTSGEKITHGRCVWGHLVDDWRCMYPRRKLVCALQDYLRTH